MSIGFDTHFKKFILIHYSTTIRITYIGVDASILPMVGHDLRRGPGVQHDGEVPRRYCRLDHGEGDGRTMAPRPPWV